MSTIPRASAANDVQTPAAAALSQGIRDTEARYWVNREARLARESVEALARWATVPPAPPVTDDDEILAAE